MTPLILASGSATRLRLLRAAGLAVEPVAPRVDEEAAKAALRAEGFGARAVADALAELKALRVAARVAGDRPEALVLGCDQTLALGSEILSKPASPAEALDQLRALGGRTHSLFSAAVLARQAERGDRAVVAVVAAGALDDDGFRSAVEDVLAAGAVVAFLSILTLPETKGSVLR